MSSFCFVCKTMVYILCGLPYLENLSHVMNWQFKLFSEIFSTIAARYLYFRVGYCGLMWLTLKVNVNFQVFM